MRRSRAAFDVCLLAGKTKEVSETVFQRVGGAEFFEELVAGFYQRVASDQVLRPMYPDDLSAAERRLRMFLIQYFGGPTTYSDERGHPRLRMRHFQFPIDRRAKEAWLTNMYAAFDDVLASGRFEVQAPDEETIRSYLSQTAQFLVNRGGFSLRG